jgi:hypothetical protein
MSSKSTLNAKNLEALGAERLAQLLIEISTGDAAAKRKLRLALAGAEGPKEAARAIVKRLTSIANAKSAIGWKQRKAFMEDLETQRRGIVEQVGKDDPQEALLLMWRFMSLANPVVLRCQGGDDSVMDVFHKACEDLGPLVMAARPGLDLLVDTVFDALSQNLFSQFDRLIAVLTPALGPEGLDQLRQRLEGVMRERSSDKEPEAGTERLTDVQYLRSVADRRTQRIVKRALLALADAQGDPDAFLAQIDMESRRICANAISIAERFLRANRPAEALEILDAADVDDDDWERMDWQDARIKVLDALNRPAEARCHFAGRASSVIWRLTIYAVTSRNFQTSRISMPKIVRWRSSWRRLTCMLRSNFSLIGGRLQGHRSFCSSVIMNWMETSSSISPQQPRRWPRTSPWPQRLP